ncbi:MAG: MaoC family dehydratase [Pseudomonadota bacterium]
MSERTDVAAAEPLYFEDMQVGRHFNTGSIVLEEARMIEFAREFDPQPMHTDPEAAGRSIFGGLIGSGWYTAALTMRLVIGGEMKPDERGRVGLGIELLRWPTPTRPGDVLTAVTEVLEARPSASRPDRGIVKLRTLTYNQRREVMQELVANVLVPRRPAGDPPGA